MSCGSLAEIEAAFDAIEAIALTIEPFVDVGHVALQAGKLVLLIGKVLLDRRHASAEIADIVVDLVDLAADRPQLLKHHVLDVGVHGASLAGFGAHTKGASGAEAAGRPPLGANPVGFRRLSRGLTLKQLAKAAGVSHACVGHIETGRNRGTPKTPAAIEKVLNVPPGAPGGCGEHCAMEPEAGERKGTAE